MAIREGRWDCPSCGSTRIYGRHVDCPGCGRPRPAGTRFYLSERAPVVTDAAQLAEARAGADWICGHCAATSRATLDACGGCGAPRGSSPTQPVVDHAPGEVPRSGDAPAPEWTCVLCRQQNAGDRQTCANCRFPRRERPAPAAPPPDGTPAEAEADPPSSSSEPSASFHGPEYGGRNRGTGLVVVAASVLLVLAGLNSARRPGTSIHDLLSPPGSDLVPGMVASRRWEREVRVQERIIVEGTDLYLPDSAQVLDSSRVVQRYEQVLVGYRTEAREVLDEREVTELVTRTREVSDRVQTGSRTYVCGQRDLGNGYFEDRTCQAPIYETRTRTETYQEPVTRTERGTRTVQERVPVYRDEPVYATRYHWRAPRWNTVRVDTARGDTAAPAWPVPALGPGQRQGTRTERPIIAVRQMGMVVHEIEVSPYEWGRYRAGQPVALRPAGSVLGRRILPADSLPACRRWRAGGGGEPPPDSMGCTPRMASGGANVPRAPR